MDDDDDDCHVFFSDHIFYFIYFDLCQVTLIWCFGLVVWCSAKMSFSGPKKTTNAENMIQSRENDEKT